MQGHDDIAKQIKYNSDVMHNNIDMVKKKINAWIVKKNY